MNDFFKKLPLLIQIYSTMLFLVTNIFNVSNYINFDLFNKQPFNLNATEASKLEGEVAFLLITEFPESGTIQALNILKGNSGC